MELELAVPAVQSLKNIFNPPIDGEQIVHYYINMEGGNRASDPAKGNEMNKLISLGWLLLVQWPRGLYLHTTLVALACAAGVAR